MRKRLSLTGELTARALVATLAAANVQLTGTAEAIENGSPADVYAHRSWIYGVMGR